MERQVAASMLHGPSEGSAISSTVIRQQNEEQQQQQIRRLLRKSCLQRHLNVRNCKISALKTKT